MVKQWHPLFTLKAEIEIIEKKIIEIDQVIENYSDSINDTGLYTGLSGFLLNKVILWKHFNNEKYYDESEKLLNRVFDIIESKENNDLSYCSGLAGIGLLIKYLADNNVFDLDHEAILNEFDQQVQYALQYCLQRNDFDFLYGATGLGIYLLERKDAADYSNDIKSIIEAIEKVSTLESIGRRLDQYEPYEPEFVGTNMGLAHGIPAIIVFLSNACKKGVMAEKAGKLAKEFVMFIMANKNENSDDVSIFPNFITDHHAHKDRYSRLAWCYGDLGICMSLLQYADTFGDKAVHEFTREVLKKNSFRKQNLEPMPVSDPFICHGAAGLAHMFNRAFSYLGTDELREASLTWTKETISFLDNKDFFKSIKMHEERLDILNGIAGTSLVLSGLITRQDPSWDKYFLLS